MGEYLTTQEFTNGTDGELAFLKAGEVIPVWGSQKFKATRSSTTTSRGQIGTRRKLNKITKQEYKITMTCDYWVVGLLTEWNQEFERTGKWPKIDLIATNEDKGTSQGRLSKQYLDLVPDGEITEQELDESNEAGLTMDITFKASGVKVLENLKRPTNIGRE